MNDGSGPIVRRPSRGLSTSALLGGVVLIWGVFVGGLMIVAYAFTDPAVVVLEDREVGIELTEFEITPDIITVGPGTDLTFLIDNVGDAQHNLQISTDVGTDRIKPGESAVLDAGVVTGSYAIWCSIKGHREAGMEAQVVLT